MPRPFRPAALCGNAFPPIPIAMRVYTSVSVFLFSALALIAPSGYAVGALLLLAGSVTLLNRGSLKPDREDKLLTLLFFSYFAVHVALNVVHGARGTEYDAPVRFLLVIPVVLLLRRTAPFVACFWGGLAVGAIAAGSYAAWEIMVLELDRVGGNTNPIQYGNIALLLGLLSLAGMAWARQQQRAGLWSAFLLAGAAMGIAGSLFTGSRGSWLALPVAFAIMAYCYRGAITKGQFLAAMTVTVAALVAATAVTDLTARIQLAYTEASGYLHARKPQVSDDANNSVGARLEMWRMGWMLIPEHPLLGWGKKGYMQEAARLADTGVVHPVVTEHAHLHNGYLDATVKRGILGLISLLTLYVCLLALFARHVKRASISAKPYAVAGLLLPACYMTFDLTQAFLTHINGVMMLTFLTAMIWALLRHQEQA